MPRSPHIAWLSALTLMSCHQYTFVSELGYSQASWNNEVDILIVSDNSESMEPYNQALRSNFARFMEDLQEAEQTLEAIPQDDLSGSVEAALFYIDNFTRFIEYNVAMTTTEIVQGNYSPGQSGSLVLEEVLAPSTEDIQGRFSAMVDWVIYHPAALGLEQGLDAMRLSICKGHPDPTTLNETTRDDLRVGCSDVPPERYGETASLYREGAPLAVVIVTDEGDFSELRGEDLEDPSDDLTVDDYLAFFEAADKRVVASVIGPTIPQDDTGDGILCNPSSSPNRTITRYADLVAGTGGILEPICSPDDPREPNSNFAEALGDIGALISGLQNRFELDRAPEVSSIIVLVNDSLMAPDPDNGWAYVQSQGRHFVEFRGDALPGFDSKVEVYFRPIAAAGGEDPRSLPF